MAKASHIVNNGAAVGSSTANQVNEKIFGTDAEKTGVLNDFLSHTKHTFSTDRTLPSDEFHPLDGSNLAKPKSKAQSSASPESHWL